MEQYIRDRLEYHLEEHGKNVSQEKFDSMVEAVLEDVSDFVDERCIDELI